MDLTLLWMDLWVDGVTLHSCFNRLFDLSENKFVTVSEMFHLGRDVNGEAWKWRRRLFVWEEDQVRECKALVFSTILRMVWRIDGFGSCTFRKGGEQHLPIFVICN